MGGVLYCITGPLGVGCLFHFSPHLRFNIGGENLFVPILLISAVMRLFSLPLVAYGLAAALLLPGLSNAQAFDSRWFNPILPGVSRNIFQEQLKRLADDF